MSRITTNIHALSELILPRKLDFFQEELDKFIKGESNFISKYDAAYNTNHNSKIENEYEFLYCYAVYHNIIKVVPWSKENNNSDIVDFISNNMKKNFDVSLESILSDEELESINYIIEQDSDILLSYISNILEKNSFGLWEIDCKDDAYHIFLIKYNAKFYEILENETFIKNHIGNYDSHFNIHKLAKIV